MENRGTAPVMSLGDWLITLIVASIPIVGFIMLLVWAFSSSTNPNKANFCKAYLIIMVIAIALFFLLGGAAFMTAMSGVGSSGI
ncbi:MAG: hypothetical protein J0L88_06100 [Xanthomonadales bacterium]|nr:hypothetical protein [Xanthomonadales bacterium]